MNSPAHTIMAGNSLSHFKAFLMDGGNAQSNGREKHRWADSPARTVVSGDGPARAFIAAQGSYGDNMPTADDSQPALTATANSNQSGIRAWANGRVVKMTPRALARFQTLPDWYELPERTGDAVTIIGNGVPCRFMQLVGERFMAGVK